MDEARVVIDLKEGVIELEGPVDFVQHYLEEYRPAIKRLGGSTQRAAGVKAAPRRRRTGRGGKSIPCTRAILNELEAGFFDEQRSTGEIKQRLIEAGFSFNDGNVRNSLRRLVAAGTLGSVGKSSTLRYQRPQ
jgi:hypothetical protein